VLARSAIVPSRTNPRTHIDPRRISRSWPPASRITACCSRPWCGRCRAHALQETFEGRKKGEPLPTHEIVCGECRWRGCWRGGHRGPAGARFATWTDIEVLQIQLVENLKRRDLHPLEEAEGFDRLIKDHGLTACPTWAPAWARAPATSSS
jgi:hypothetical protein